jgi:hypothetical protein
MEDLKLNPPFFFISKNNVQTLHATSLPPPKTTYRHCTQHLCLLQKQRTDVARNDSASSENNVPTLHATSPKYLMLFT